MGQKTRVCQYLLPTHGWSEYLNEYLTLIGFIWGKKCYIYSEEYVKESRGGQRGTIVYYILWLWQWGGLL